MIPGTHYADTIAAMLDMFDEEKVINFDVLEKAWSEHGKGSKKMDYAAEQLILAHAPELIRQAKIGAEVERNRGDWK